MMLWPIINIANNSRYFPQTLRFRLGFHEEGKEVNLKFD